MSVDAILEQAKALTRDELSDLIERLQEAADGVAPLADAQKAELDRRLAASDATPGRGIPWEVVLAESLARARR